MTEIITVDEPYEASFKTYTDYVHQRFSKNTFKKQRAAWLERQKMLKYFQDNPPTNESIAAAHAKEERWLNDLCSESWRLGNEQIGIIKSAKLEMANTELWQVTYQAEIEGFVYLSVVLYSKDEVKHLSGYLIKDD